jgi:protein-S-isoprenylcysteine O-methyltransferase Ste14
MLELKVGIIRGIALFFPIVLALVLILLREKSFSSGEFAGIFLSFLWCATTLSILNAIIPHFGGWNFNAHGGLFYSAPVDMLLGWAVLWGVLPLLALPEQSSLFGGFFNKLYFTIPLTALLLFVIDLIAMPFLYPVVALHETWIVFDVGLLIIVLVPALLIASWTRQKSHLAARTIMQVILFSLIFLVLIPAIILEQTSPAGFRLPSLLYWQNQFAIQMIIIFAVIGISAVQEFKERGGGTPFPWDPPERLVTTGLYAYVANPMQISMVLIYPVLGFLLNNTWVVLAGIMAIIFYSGIAHWHQDHHLSKTFGDSWRLYRKNVRPWFPRWRPWMEPAKESAVVYFDTEGCGFCRDLAAWYQNQHPLGIAVEDARKYPDRDLYRMSYRSPDGVFEEDGIIALGRALEHINLAWAFIGCGLRLPILSTLIQFFTDHFLVQPHWVRRSQ